MVALITGEVLQGFCLRDTAANVIAALSVSQTSPPVITLRAAFWSRHHPSPYKV